LKEVISIANLLDAATHVAIIATDAEGTITLFNKGAERTLGYSAEELVGKATPLIFHLESEIVSRSVELGMARSGFECFTDQVKVVGFEARDWTFVAKDGKHISVNLVVTPVRHGSEIITGYLGIAQDVSERRMLESQLREARASLENQVHERTSQLEIKTRQLLREISERQQTEQLLQAEREKFATIIEKSPIAMVMISREGMFEYVNPKFHEVFGYELRQVNCGKEWLRRAYPDPSLRKEVVSTWIHDLKGSSPGEQRPRVYPVICADGKEKIIRFKPVQLISGKHLMTCEDITDRVRDQRALSESEAKYRSLYEESKRREELYQSLLNSSVDAVIIYDMLGLARYVNPSFTAKFGWTMDEVLGRKIPFVPESEIECTVKRVSDLVEKGIPCSGFETRRYTKEGSILQVSISASLYLDHEGEPAGMLVIMTDITERKKAEDALRQSEARYRNLFEYSKDGIVLTTTLGELLDFNPEFVEMVAMGDKRQLEGKKIQDFYVDPSEASKIREVLQTGYMRNFSISFRRVDGREIETLSTVHVRRDESGKVLGFEGIIRDVTELKAYQREQERLISELTIAKESLHYQATHDGLSGLWNRSAIMDILRRELSRSFRTGEPTGVILADLDRFKSVNDFFGHEAGDYVLREVSGRILSSIRPYDSAGRYGGEEFIVIAPGCGLNQIERLAERLRENISRDPVDYAGAKLEISASLGVSSTDKRMTIDIDSLIRDADKALYRAKRLGRDRVEVFGDQTG
jgi:diguanylate cyclase (GGDEF)-like protein/PAS domain S-box-containing protein